jgi:hypothetical protein
MPSLYHPASKTTVVTQLIMADSFLKRLKGLMFSRQLPTDTGLVIEPCQQIHTHFMRYPIDVMFVSKEWQVIHVERDIKPWRFTRFYKQSHYVIEVNADVASAVFPGHDLQVLD